MPRDPKDFDCEWCGPGHPARHAVERERKVKSGFVKTGMFIYCCDAHKHLADAEKVIKKR